ncbi:tubulin tyrosine ligase family [Naegleria gruberi]|uniref:Tubulin tyrosine ligase family n=1 Tax=Naegleria gruberi TaxID=5762 RepID=D2VG36_NAEGR|nr:tubulin tyrosine ligase family [Naegleria gruberi]EFC44199.1 tubulin tyrosine ligase family [Naegleria gruberi]|eukprot:XP_002676943.1 tubulin tyrosine ligase family [Naegleria gruberi strain NEG-M]
MSSLLPKTQEDQQATIVVELEEKNKLKRVLDQVESSSSIEEKPLVSNKKRIKLFDEIESKQGVCWHFRKKGFCKLGSECKFRHIKVDDYGLIIENDLSSSNNSSSLDNNSNTTLGNNLEEPTLSLTIEPSSLSNSTSLNVEQPRRKLCYWISKAKETKSATSALRRTYEENGFNLILSTDNTETENYTAVFWGHTFPHTSDLWKKLPSYTYINHFPNSHHLSNKSLMAMNFQEISKDNSSIKFKSEFIPHTFYFPSQINLFFNYLKTEKDDIWIIKPQGSGEGRGIRLFSNSKQILQEEFPTIPTSEIESGFVSEETLKRKEIRKHKIVVCKYVRNPLLINGKKFDMRLAYLYKDGIVRLASEDYTESEETLTNAFIHITNNTVNDKKNRPQHETAKSQYGFFCNMNLNELEEYFQKNSLDYQLFWDRLKNLVSESLKMTIFNTEKQDDTFKACSSKCFEIYGFDVMIDKNLQPYLLEVNSMPDLSAVSNTSHLVLNKDFTIKSKMLVNALNLIGITIEDENTVLSRFINISDYNTDDYLNNFEKIIYQ